MIAGTDEYLTLLSILIPVGINNGIKNLLNLDTDIKWPNDIYFQNKKLGGILIESKMNSGTNNYAIGIGLNVNETEDDFPEELNENAISIKTILGKKTILGSENICFGEDLLIQNILFDVCGI